MLVRKIHKASHEKHQEYLLATANLNEDADDTQKAHALRQMMCAESSLEAYRRLGYARGKYNKQQAINRILVPISWPTRETYSPDQPLTLSDPKLTEPDDWRTVTCPTEIELMLTLCNKRHFGQAEYEGTPFMQEPLRTLFNWSASTHQAELVLEGFYTNDEIDSVCQSLLDSMTRSTPLDELKATVSVQDFRGKFKK